MGVNDGIIQVLRTKKAEPKTRRKKSAGERSCYLITKIILHEKMLKGVKTMLRIMMMNDPDRFLSVVNESRGDVLLRLPDESRVNLKNNRPAQQMLRMMKPDEEGLWIDLTDSRDTQSFIRYMSEEAC